MASSLTSVQVFFGLPLGLTRVHVWKLKEEQTCEEYKSMVRDKVEEAEWKHLDVNEHWCRMKR